MKTILIISHLVISASLEEAVEAYEVQAPQPMLSEIYIVPEVVEDFDYLISLYENAPSNSFKDLRVSTTQTVLTIQDIRNKGQPRAASTY